MAKRDINLLESLNQSTKKKSSSSMTAILIIGVVALVGVMVFLFVTAKVDIANNQALIDDYNKQLEKESQVAELEKQYAQLKQEYSDKIQQVISVVYPNQTAEQRIKMSSEFINLLFDYQANHQVSKPVDGDVDSAIKIESINITEQNISMVYMTKNHEDALAFAEFMAGVQDNEESRKNKERFSNVAYNFPGLPVEGDGKEYTITMNLSFNINWEAFV